MSTPKPASRGTFPVSLRFPEDKRELIDRAARAQGQSQDEVMIAAVERMAEESLLDQAQVQVDLATYEYLLSVLDEPPPGEAYERLMNAPRPWQS